MARRLSKTDISTLTIHDNLSDSEIILSYRRPTTKERQGFENLSVQRKGKKVKFKHSEARLKYGGKILTGIREGDFEIEKAGTYVPVSSDPSSQNYVENWNELIKEMAPDIVQILAAQVFEASVELAELDDDDGKTDEDDGEEIGQD